MNIEIRNGRVIDPKNGVDRDMSLFIGEGRVTGLGQAPASFAAERTIDASGCIVCPGLIDLSARLNSIEAELAAAVAGGVTSVVVPPDATPPLDEPELADRLIHRGKEIGMARVLPLGALTVGLRGEHLSELAGLKKAGCVAFSQAQVPLVDTEALLRALEYATTFGFAVWLQAQDYWLSRNGIAHEGEVASRLGLAGIPVAAETIAIATILQLVRDTGCRIHLTRLPKTTSASSTRTPASLRHYAPRATARRCRALQRPAWRQSAPITPRSVPTTNCFLSVKRARVQPALKYCCR